MTVRVIVADKDKKGSCNSCNERELYFKVYEIYLGTMTFRLCYKCAKEMVKKLGQYGCRREN